jgi:hypothetical protein
MAKSQGFNTVITIMNKTEMCKHEKASSRRWTKLFKCVRVLWETHTGVLMRINLWFFVKIMLCVLIIQFHLCTLILYISFLTVTSIGDSETPCDDTLKEGVVEGFYYPLAQLVAKGYSITTVRVSVCVFVC